MNNNEEIHLCEYGCGQEAKYYFKYSKKWCCSSNTSQCNIMRIKNGERCKGKPTSKKGKIYKKIREKPELCDYGCGQEATYPLKNGKWCCSKSQNSCPKIISNKIKIKITREKPELCDYGCGQEAKYYIKSSDRWCCSNHVKKCPKFKITGLMNIIEDRTDVLYICDYGCGKVAKYIGSNGKHCCSEFFMSCSSIKKKNSDGQKRLTPEQNMKKGIANKGRKLIFTDEHRKNLSISRKGKPGPKHTEEFKESQRQRMLNGGANIALKGVKNPSKEEVKLRDMIKIIYPNCEFQYGVLSYSLDVALPEYKIAIEYDGYFHFDSQDHIDYHTKRRNKIINEGWMFIRYTVFDKFPTIEKIKEDIEKMLCEKKEETK